MNLDAHIQQKTNLCRPWSDLKTCFVINHKNGILFIFESFHCCLYILEADVQKQNATHFQHHLRNSKWCNSSQNKNTNYELRGYVRMLCTDEMRMISLLIEVVSTPCTSPSKELFLATQQMWHNSRFASQLIWHRKMLFEHYDLYSY